MFKKLSIFFVILIILAFLGWWAHSQLYLSFSSDSDEGLKIFRVEQGEGLLDIASNLKEEGLIRSKLLFTFYVFMRGEQNLLQAGEYNLSSLMSISEIAQKVIKGETAEIKITIIEGWNLKDIARYFEDKEIAQKENFLEIAKSPMFFTEDFEFLNDKPAEMGLEGYLFPDTYYIGPMEGAEEIIKRMLNNFGKKLIPELREEIHAQDKTIFEVIIMASLLEREVQSKEDKKIVSGIFWKRLANNYPLQSCATIAYILEVDKWRYSVEDTKIESPYNTYQHLGLPPAPICNPGLESIQAAIRPEESGFWYYLSTPEGETIFSRTLEQHNIAKAEYLR